MMPDYVRLQPADIQYFPFSRESKPTLVKHTLEKYLNTGHWDKKVKFCAILIKFLINQIFS